MQYVPKNKVDNNSSTKKKEKSLEEKKEVGKNSDPNKEN